LAKLGAKVNSREAISDDAELVSVGDQDAS
jgi:hypothetical protein